MTLGVRPKPDAGRGSSSKPKNYTEKALQRDDYTCRFCGFRSRKYQRAIPCAEAGKPPFATVCTFCEQYMVLERGGITGAGYLVWLPEIQQPELNHIARAIYAARAGEGDMATLATRALDVLSARRSEAKKRLGSDDPLLLATVMHEALTEKERLAAAHKLEGVRLLPADKYMVRTSRGDINHFPDIVKYWLSSEGPYARLQPQEWGALFKDAMGQAGHA